MISYVNKGVIIMIKKIVSAAVTVCIIILANWGVATLLSANFFTFSFLTSLGIIVIIWFC